MSLIFNVSSWFCSYLTGAGCVAQTQPQPSVSHRIAPLSQREQFRATQIAGCQSLLSGAVQFRTIARYSSDWKRYRNFFCQWLENPQDEDLFLVNIPLRQQLITLASYMFYALNTLQLKACSIVSSMSGISHQFRANCLSLDVFGHPSIRACKTALGIEERKLSSFTEVQRRFPLTVEMLQRLLCHTRSTGRLEDWMAGVGIAMAFFSLLRTSEYVPSVAGLRNNSCHAILAADVLFEVLVAGEKRMIESFLVTPDMWSCVQLVKFVLRSAKNDKLRVGSVFWFRNQPCAGGLNIVLLVFEWAVAAGHQADSFFMSFHVRSHPRPIWLTYNAVDRLIKGVAVAFGLQSSRYGTYSARVGGACTLRAGGASDATIQMMGRWKSLSSCLTYQESSLREYDAMQDILRDPLIFTADDVKLIHARGTVKKV